MPREGAGYTRRKRKTGRNRRVIGNKTAWRPNTKHNIIRRWDCSDFSNSAFCKMTWRNQKQVPRDAWRKQLVFSDSAFKFIRIRNLTQSSKKAHLNPVLLFIIVWSTLLYFSISYMAVFWLQSYTRFSLELQVGNATCFKLWHLFLLVFCIQIWKHL